VRLTSFAPSLRVHGVQLDFTSALSDEDYRTLKGAASPRRKAAVVFRSTRRVAAHARVAGHDVLLIHRLRSLVPLPGIDPPRRLDAYDFDDALFCGRVSTGSVSPNNERFSWVKMEARRSVSLMRHARLVIAANEYLAEAAVRHNDRVVVIPSCVDPQLYRQRLHDDRMPVRVGWIGSESTVGYLRDVVPAMDALNRDRLRALLVVVGPDPGVRRDWIEHRQWRLESEAHELADLDIGIMPLTDDPWTRGKSGYKLLQYFAAGIPAVASPVGVNRKLLGEGARGIAATSTEEWTAALRQLIDDPEQRRELGEAGRRYVCEHYSYRRWAPELADALLSLAA
jgi:glycosyltransferase involved in cell wall biosynthesis